MDLEPTVIQLVDQLELPVLPRDPSVGDPLNMWYIKVFRDTPLWRACWFSFLLAFTLVLTRASRRPYHDHEELWRRAHGQWGNAWVDGSAGRIPLRNQEVGEQIGRRCPG